MGNKNFHVIESFPEKNPGRCTIIAVFFTLTGKNPKVAYGTFISYFILPNPCLSISVGLGYLGLWRGRT
jgi:hypothetical protein